MPLNKQNQIIIIIKVSDSMYTLNLFLSFIPTNQRF